MAADFRNIVSVLMEKCKDTLDINKKDDTGIFRAFVSSIVTQGRTGVETILQKVQEDKGFEDWKPEHFSTEQGKKLLKDHIGNSRKSNIIFEESKRMIVLGIRNWIESLRKGEIYIGLKTKDEFLKEIGFLEHIPIDRYYPPFLARTGLLIQYLSTSHKDPGKFMRGLADKECYEAYKDMMVNLCRNNLKGLKYRGLDLSMNPGIVDMAIWRHCARAKEAFDICGKEPHCARCIIKNLCEYGRQI